MDHSENANHGTVFDAVLTTDRFGNQNAAYDFNGMSSRIIAPDIDALELVNNFSICAWVYPRTSNSLHNIVAKHSPPSNTDGSWVFRVYNDGFDFEGSPYFEQLKLDRYLIKKLIPERNGDTYAA